MLLLTPPMPHHRRSQMGPSGAWASKGAPICLPSTPWASGTRRLWRLGFRPLSQIPGYATALHMRKINMPSTERVVGFPYRLVLIDFVLLSNVYRLLICMLYF